MSLVLRRVSEFSENFVETILPVERLKVSVVPFDSLNVCDVCLNARFLEFPLLKPHPKALFVHSLLPRRQRLPLGDPLPVTQTSSSDSPSCKLDHTFNDSSPACYLSVRLDGRHIAGLIRVFAALNLFAAAVALINLVLGPNYMCLSAPPDSTLSPSFVGPRPWYIVVLEFVALATLLAVYAPFALAERESARREPKR